MLMSGKRSECDYTPCETPTSNKHALAQMLVFKYYNVTFPSQRNLNFKRKREREKANPRYGEERESEVQSDPNQCRRNDGNI